MGMFRTNQDEFLLCYDGEYPASLYILITNTAK